MFWLLTNVSETSNIECKRLYSRDCRYTPLICAALYKRFTLNVNRNDDKERWKLLREVENL